mgnify:CR=1|jgi:multisubunit Na+/H+ antiporter MnhB subunit
MAPEFIAWLLLNVGILLAWFVFLLLLKWLAEYWITKQYPHLKKKKSVVDEYKNK